MEAHALRARAHGGRGAPGPLQRIASDERLVARVRAGDDRAFEALFERYQRPILSFCRHMLGSREEAEDAAQHAFLSAYNGIRAGDRELQLRPWLYTIARNQCLSQLRTRREQSSLEDAEPSVEGLASEVQRRADLREVLRDLACLPEDQRAALVLAELGDLSHDEIAGVLECPKGKVKALVFQARSSLAASRQARDTSCAEIREQLATLSGGSLRRTTLRRHLRECADCRQFGDEVKRQRAAMAVVLPVLPTAGLKAGVLSGIGVSPGAGAAAAAVAGGGGVASVLVGGGAAKLIVAAAVAASGVGGGVAAVRAVDDRGTQPARLVAPAPTSSPAATRAALTGRPAGATTAEPTPARGEHAPGKRAGGVANGRNPKGDRGRSATAPGRAGTSPGRAGTSPGRARTAPGRARNRPSRARSRRSGERGRSDSARGGLRAPSPRSRSRSRRQTTPAAPRTPRTTRGRSGAEAPVRGVGTDAVTAVP